MTHDELQQLKDIITQSTLPVPIIGEILATLASVPVEDSPGLTLQQLARQVAAKRKVSLKQAQNMVAKRIERGDIKTDGKHEIRQVFWRTIQVTVVSQDVAQALLAELDAKEQQHGKG